VLPKRNRRSIHVGEHQYFWHFTTGREFDHRLPQLVVQPAGGGSMLIVRQPAWPEVTPSFVSAAVSEALAAGWLASEGAGLFVLARAGCDDGVKNAEAGIGPDANAGADAGFSAAPTAEAGGVECQAAITEFVLDGSGITSLESFWEAYVHVVRPEGAEYFGRNLAALNDALWGGPGWPGEGSVLRITASAAMEQHLGREFLDDLREAFERSHSAKLVLE
jgi:Barstar (barnase inhibitor)